MAFLVSFFEHFWTFVCKQLTTQSHFIIQAVLNYFRLIFKVIKNFNGQMIFSVLHLEVKQKIIKFLASQVLNLQDEFVKTEGMPSL